jgi:hypothetical protein
LASGVDPIGVGRPGRASITPRLFAITVGCVMVTTSPADRRIGDGAT